MASAGGPAARQASSRAWAATKRGALAAASAAASEPGRPGAIANRSSSSRPISGDFSTVASVRSSSGSKAARPAATRSITAIESRSSSRSAPAVAMSRSFSARIIASKNGPRERTRISTSPVATRRSAPASTSNTRSLAFSPVQSLIAEAMRRAATAAGSSARSASTGGFQSAGSCGFSALIGGQTSMQPGRARRNASWGGGGPSSPVKPRQASSAANTASTPARTIGAERNDTDSGTSAKASPASSWRRCSRRRIAENMCGAAPWNEKIDCFSSPTAKTVRGAARRALAGEELLAQLGEDRPLRRRSVLRLVDQQMLERRVELVEHPGGVGALDQPRGRGRSGRRNRAAPRIPFSAA